MLWAEAPEIAYLLNPELKLGAIDLGRITRNM
jgi:hypothetical protein